MMMTNPKLKQDAIDNPRVGDGGNAGASDVKWAQKATLIERGEE
jgi:hypothetical protein